MPRQSIKQKMYNTFEKRYLLQQKLMEANIAFVEEYANHPELDDSDKEDLEDMAEVFRYNIEHNWNGKMIKYIKSKRYICQRKHKVPKPVTKARRLDYLLNQIDSNGFVNELRMDKSSFDALYNLIEDHPLYESSDQRPQTDIRLQLAIVLERLGTYGNGTSVQKLARRSGVGSKYLIPL